MKVKVAETAGFCFGVKRAVDKVYELIDTEQKPIFTLGPIIHNEGVVADLEAKGVRVITESDLDSPDDNLQKGIVVIRSHGVGKSVYDKLKEKNISYVDVTCPFVLKIHRIVEKESLAGNHVIIIGDKDHPEVQGICGWCQGPHTVIKSREEAEAFLLPEVPRPGKEQNNHYTYLFQVSAGGESSQQTSSTFFPANGRKPYEDEVV